MIQNATLIFDIGKTNKKLYVLDQDLNEVHKEYLRFNEIKDDEGYPCDDLQAISYWIIESVREILGSDKYKVKNINFSTYGASLVHLNKEGKVIAPFYNYLKPFPEDLQKHFFTKYQNEIDFSLTTASPFMGFLNSGLQLYYIKYKRPDIFKELSTSLHLPQYLSYLLTKNLTSDYTSMGCHTGLWNYNTMEYAEWVKKEGLDKYLPKVETASTVNSIKLHGHEINVGMGVHDSSSALVPYLENVEKKFVLLSTGTWSICMNPFNESELSTDELEKDCLNFMGPSGQSVKASRLFLGQQLRDKAKELGTFFNVEYHQYKKIKFDLLFEAAPAGKGQLLFNYPHLDVTRFGFKNALTEDLSLFKDFDQAYHQLIHELTELQIGALKLAIGDSKIEHIYIDGGFANNEVFTQMLANKLPDYVIRSTEFALGSSLGAAVLVNPDERVRKRLSENYKYRTHHQTVAKGKKTW